MKILNRNFLLFGIVLALLTGFPLSARALDSCCVITGIEKGNGIITAKENSTGRTFRFKVNGIKPPGSLSVNDARFMENFHAGRKVFVIFESGKVSLDGKTTCCTLVDTPGVKKPLVTKDGLKLVPKFNGGLTGNQGNGSSQNQSDGSGNFPGDSSSGTYNHSNGLNGGFENQNGEIPYSDGNQRPDFNDQGVPTPEVSNPLNKPENSYQQGQTIQGDRPWYEKMDPPPANFNNNNNYNNNFNNNNGNNFNNSNSNNGTANNPNNFNNNDNFNDFK